jgi:hypothetical protein
VKQSRQVNSQVTGWDISTDPPAGVNKPPELFWRPPRSDLCKIPAEGTLEKCEDILLFAAYMLHSYPPQGYLHTPWGGGNIPPKFLAHPPKTSLVRNQSWTPLGGCFAPLFPVVSSARTRRKHFWGLGFWCCIIPLLKFQIPPRVKNSRNIPGYWIGWGQFKYYITQKFCFLLTHKP